VQKSAFVRSFKLCLEALRRADPASKGPTDCVKYQETEKAAEVQQSAIEV
jgi:hypothetical protein